MKATLFIDCLCKPLFTGSQVILFKPGYADKVKYNSGPESKKYHNIGTLNNGILELSET